MGDKTNISWTEATWNPTTGCSHVSPGCEHCYAEALSLRRGWSAKPWTAPNAVENVVLHPDRLDLPRRWREPKRIFVDSMSDLFHDQVPDDFILQVFTTMRATPRHIYQLLTKRPARMLEFMTRLSWMTHPQGLGGYVAYLGPPGSRVLPNVWLGVSIEDQRRADERIPLLLKAPAAVHFLSCEPLLGPVDLRPEWLAPQTEGQWLNIVECGRGLVNWVIVGGESGSGYRPMDLGWARSLRDQCQATRVPYFYKQSSGPRPGMNATLDGVEWHEFPGT